MYKRSFYSKKRLKRSKTPNDLSVLQRKADAIFSDYTRVKDTNDDGIGKCCTCGKFIQVFLNPEPKLYRIMGGDCGHYQERNKKSTRFEEINGHLQDRYCNFYKKGQKDLHAKYIEERYGIEVREKLDRKSRNIVHDYRMILIWAIQHYTEKFEAALAARHIAVGG